MNTKVVLRWIMGIIIWPALSFSVTTPITYFTSYGLSNYIKQGHRITHNYADWWHPYILEWCSSSYDYFLPICNEVHCSLNFTSASVSFATLQYISYHHFGLDFLSRSYKMLVQVVFIVFARLFQSHQFSISSVWCRNRKSILFVSYLQLHTSTIWSPLFMKAGNFYSREDSWS